MTEFKNKLALLESKERYLLNVCRAYKVLKDFMNECGNNSFHDIPTVLDVKLSSIKEEIKSLEKKKEEATKLKETRITSKLDMKRWRYIDLKRVTQSGIHETGNKHALVVSDDLIMIYHPGHTAYINRGDTTYAPSELYIISVESFYVRHSHLCYTARVTIPDARTSKFHTFCKRGYSLSKAISENIDTINSIFGVEFKPSDLTKYYTIDLTTKGVLSGK